MPPGAPETGANEGKKAAQMKEKAKNAAGGANYKDNLKKLKIIL